MNHDAEARIHGISESTGKIGVHMSAHVSVVVPMSASFAPPAKPMQVDSSKVSVKKG